MAVETNFPARNATAGDVFSNFWTRCMKIAHYLSGGAFDGEILILTKTKCLA
jgi:hypothetical protein